VLIRLDPECGIQRLEQFAGTVEPGKLSEVVKLLVALIGENSDGIRLGSENLTSPLLLRLLCLAYSHIRVVDDQHRERMSSSDTRDDAQRVRDDIVAALLNRKGEVGLTAKLKMADDPLFLNFRDRILAIAEENWAEEIDEIALNQNQASILDRVGEVPISTNELMFATLRDRLSDLNELLLSDDSPRETWSTIPNEKLMRREITRELRYLANGIYTVDQESVTGDEKETDIRLRSTASAHEAVIELKLGDARSGKDLFDTIEQQLVLKYMAPETRGSGALLITLSRERNWQHPISGLPISAEELQTVLEEEANRVQAAAGGSIFLAVFFLDLRQRLPIESEK
jgi:hypothetical protein